MSAPIRRIKQAAGKVGGNGMKNAVAPPMKDGGNKPAYIKNAVGMCDVGGQGFAKIKGAVS